MTRISCVLCYFAIGMHTDTHETLIKLCCKHQGGPDWDAMEIMKTKAHYWKKHVLEAIWIQKNFPDMQSGLRADSAQ